MDYRKELKKKHKQILSHLKTILSYVQYCKKLMEEAEHEYKNYYHALGCTIYQVYTMLEEFDRTV